ncbi:MAG TPA: UDP-N-acetylmuramoyl-tripeptide--D-alanyl-D-alanine ligase [Blastocatellia bacterium]|nr:UDP-N-acetylmuramoyl-tripeptide--D-alanyl-D-alanine ligase [Blastocatellia bacterium]
MKLGEIANVLGSRLGSTDLGERIASGYSIDSRAIREGEVFFAIRGERYDGHGFVADALAKGAAAAVVSRDFFASSDEGAKLIPVADTLGALQSLAQSVLRDWRGREVAITGSMGKTTTKEMTAAALAGAGRVIRTQGNLNNDYGLPLSILKMESGGARASDFDYAVFEMGMNHKGEIARLAEIAPPDMGAVTIVAPVHLEFFDSVDAIAEAKAELIAGIKSGGAAALNADDERVARMRGMRGDIEYRTFGIERAADVRASDIQTEGLGGARFRMTTPRGSVEARLALAGRHNIYNALAAAAVADFYEVPLEEIAAALAQVASPNRRGEVLRFAEGFTVVDDSYNSNPRALIEMATTICANPDCERKIVVAGEMLELGATGAELHREAGRRMAALGVDLLVGVRGLARQIVAGAREAGMSAESALFCETPEEAADLLTREARSGDLILIKGSRGVKTEIVVEKMKQARGQASANSKSQT